MIEGPEPLNNLAPAIRKRKIVNDAMTTSAVESRGRELCSHRVRYLRSPMYISLHLNSSSRSTSSLSSHLPDSKEHAGSHQPPVTKEASAMTTRLTPNILPHIRSSSVPNINSLAGSKQLRHALTRSNSISGYWTDLKSVHLGNRRLSSSSCHSLHSLQLSKAPSHSAPNIAKTFEETLLPTHNIFFAGRPRTPKPKQVTVKVSPPPKPSAPILLPRQKRPRRNRRVTFNDSTVKERKSAHKLRQRGPVKSAA